MKLLKLAICLMCLLPLLGCRPDIDTCRSGKVKAIYVYDWGCILQLKGKDEDRGFKIYYANIHTNITIGTTVILCEKKSNITANSFFVVYPATKEN